MDTESLRLFVHACEKLNISAAGRILGMAPAVASARLAKLETTLGAELLHRSTRKVSISLEGQDFLHYAREIIAQEDAALAALGKGEADISGTLRFTAPSTFAQLYIAPLLPSFMDMHPNLTLDLHFSDTRFDLIQGSYDLALRNSVLGDSSLTARKLADDTRVLCAAPDYLAEFGTPKKPYDLQSHRLIGFNDLEPRQLITADGYTATFAPKQAAIRLVMNDGHSQKQATRSGAGISINSLWAVHQDLQTGTLIRVLPDYVLANSPALWLIYPKSNVVSAKVRAFMDFLIDHIGKRQTWHAT